MQTKNICKKRLSCPTGGHIWLNWICRCLLLGAGIAMVTGAVHAAADPLRQLVLDSLADIEKEIHEWDRAGSWELTATIVVGIIGGVAAALQAIKSGWARVVTAVLGVLSGVLVIVNQNCFDVDHRVYRSLAQQSHKLVRDFTMQLGLYPSPLTRDDYKDLCTQVIKLEKDVGDLQRAVFGKNTTPAAHASIHTFLPSLISTAYAMEGASDMPDWAKTLPNDADNIYFVGVANDRTAAQARDAAQQQAKAAVESSFETALRSYSKIPAEDVAHLAHEISESGEVVSTFVVPASGAYRGYALVRVPRALTALSAKSFFLAHSLPFDPKLLDQIAVGDKTKQVAATEANEQKAAAQKGVAYVHVATPADRALGAVLCQSIGEVVSAPSVEVQISQPANTVRYFNSEDAGLAAKIKDVAEKTLAAEGYSIQLQLKDEYAEGYKTPKQQHQFEVWLAPVPRIAPRVNLEVQTGTPADRIEELKKALVAAGYEVSKTENVPRIPSRNARVFYYKKSDADEANSLVKALPDLGLLSSKETATLAKAPSDFRPRHYDLRVGKDTFAGESSPP
jgi:hypothetical protein